MISNSFIEPRIEPVTQNVGFVICPEGLSKYSINSQTGDLKSQLLIPGSFDDVLFLQSKGYGFLGSSKTS